MRQTLLAILMAACLAIQAQTINVVTGSVTTQFPAELAGNMAYTDNGTKLTVNGKTYNISDITGIYVDDTNVSDSTVTVNYNGTSAMVVISGDIANDITASIDGAHVCIVQGTGINNGSGEVEYILSGSTTDGEFYMEGTYKATIQFAGLELTNPHGAAVNIQDGKRIKVSAKKNTTNTLTDGSNGSQKACLVIKGHAELQGNGTLNIYGNTKHGIKASDYMTVKNLTLNVLSAVTDGIQANGYFQQKSGNITISGVGDDGIQVELDGDTNTGETVDHEDEDSGNIYIDGGTLSLTTTADGAKGMKSDSTVVVNAGTVTINAKGGVDTTDATDPSYVAGINGGKFVQNGGNVTMTIQGTSGRGVKAYDVETNGGELSINNSATPTTISGDVKGAKGIKALNMALNAGSINITMSGNASKAIRCGDGTQSTSSGGGGWGGWGPGGGGPGGWGSKTTWTNIKGSYTQGKADGTGPTLNVTQTGGTNSSSSAKGIKAICGVTIYGGETTVNTTKSGGEGLESKTSVDIRGGQHYLKCYDDCINSAGKIYFNGGVTVCYSTGNDAVDSNAGTTGAITIGNGSVLAYMTKGDPDEGLDCDNNNYISITGTGIAISAGGKQSSTSGTISNAKQGYAFLTKPSSYAKDTYYTIADAEGNNLVTYSFETAISRNSLSFITATGMTSKGSYTIKSSTTAPIDAKTSWHGLYIGSSTIGTANVTSFTAK